MDEIKKSLYILGRFRSRLPLMLFLFLIVSIIDVMGIGLTANDTVAYAGAVRPKETAPQTKR